MMTILKESSRNWGGRSPGMVGIPGRVSVLHILCISLSLVADVCEYFEKPRRNICVSTTLISFGANQ